MTDVEQPPAQAATGETPPSKAAIGCLILIGVAFAGTIVVAVPETAYCIAGFMAAATARKARDWANGRRGHAAEEQPNEEPIDIVTALWTLGQKTGHVRLTQLQEATGLPDTKAVRVLLDEAGIPVRTGVRAGGKNGPGVHATDIPPLDRAPSGRCLCRSGATTNTNNSAGAGGREGLRVEPIGQAGTVVHTPAEASRHHAIAKTGRR